MTATLEGALPQPPSWRAVGGERSFVSNLIHDSYHYDRGRSTYKYVWV